MKRLVLPMESSITQNWHIGKQKAIYVSHLYYKHPQKKVTQILKMTKPMMQIRKMTQMTQMTKMMTLMKLSITVSVWSTWLSKPRPGSALLNGAQVAQVSTGSSWPWWPTIRMCSTFWINSKVGQSWWVETKKMSALMMPIISWLASLRANWDS